MKAGKCANKWPPPYSAYQVLLTAAHTSSSSHRQRCCNTSHESVLYPSDKGLQAALQVSKRPNANAGLHRAV